MQSSVEQKRMRKADFKAFYNEHFDRVYRFVYFRVRNNEEVAQDLTSEIFMKALAHFAKYDPNQSQSAWIMTIARNHVINHWRDQKEQVDLEDVQFTLSSGDAREKEVIEDDKRRLRAALDQLTQKERELIELKYLQGYGFKDIASLTGKTTGASRVEAHRAMKKLKAILTKQYDLPAKTTEESA